ncbi:NAD(P)H-dependent oxidoreductase [Bradyrhizobium sp. NP1]|uniref:NAD(P)H-dependent oxidoreductase n=1 Tax=Bradyrhizobium sp. NP1 TaxID=3049772 RepID=UPI0025A512C2|nr:NAD(P)H-dependent oxidoreductase [Bradyrhizobium sp. NP1]WJR77438.1 NAD(P)H-dependent oxidoreductase [Bradyrhizobium sp. NP1]
MNTLIVYAHREPRSFNAMMKDVAVNYLSDHGHDVVVSDLHKMEFDPVAGRHDFLAAADPDYFDYQAEQRNAFKTSSMAPDLRAEHEKLLWCELLILQFPLWWYGVPAILKGWIDRVMSVGFAYDRGMKFNNGGLRGRTGMVSTSTAAEQSRYSPAEPLAYASMEDTLRPLHRGLFRYVGITPAEPFIGWAVNQMSEVERQSCASAYRAHLRRVMQASRQKAAQEMVKP